MTSKSAKKVVIISDLKSKNIEQAIFILKDSDVVPFQQSIIEEANEIVQSYIRQANAGQYRQINSKRKWFWRKK